MGSLQVKRLDPDTLAQRVTNNAVGLSGNISPASARPTVTYRVYISYYIQKEKGGVFVNIS